MLSDNSTEFKNKVFEQVAKELKSINFIFHLIIQHPMAR